MLRPILLSITLGLFPVSNSFSQDYKKEGTYCAAVRGNGELAPAHWGSFARLVERYGMPKSMAGGSSASITMFLMESISLNDMAKTNIERAFLIKSFEGYMQALAFTDEGKALAGLYNSKGEIAQLAQKVSEALSQSSTGAAAILSNPEILAQASKVSGLVKKVLSSDDLKELVNPEMIQYISKTHHLSLKEDSTPEEVQIVQYRISQIKSALENFGKFNAQTDKTLFFRPGLIDFSKFAKLFGRMANFYAGYGLGDDNEVFKRVKSQMTNIIQKCSKISEGKTWSEIAAENPLCQRVVIGSILEYRTEYKKQVSNNVVLKERINENIGSHMSTFPTTSVLTGDAVTNFLTESKNYSETSNPNFGDHFSISIKDIRFGYWGKEAELSTIAKNIKNSEGFKDGQGKQTNLSKDLKSSLFYSLGNQKWLAALSTSPAEPGLSRIKNIDDRDDILSAGGWSDLHPTLVLKAAGCRNIIYITRRGGETLFGQGAVKKLLNIDGYEFKDWANLTPAQKKEKNAKGNSKDQSSTWSKLYNLANPNSSYAKSIELADAVWCTDWDSLLAQDGISPLLKEGYDAPIYNAQTTEFFNNGISSEAYDSQLRELTRKDSSLEYSGCIPK